MKTRYLNIAFPAALTGALMLLPGCESIQYAGSSSMSIKPVILNDKSQGWALDVRDGKQYASIDVSVTKDGENYSLKLSAKGVEAFKGQQISAGAVHDGAKVVETGAAIAGGVLAAPVIGPVLGGAMAAGSVPAAVVGAAIGASATKAAQP